MANTTFAALTQPEKIIWSKLTMRQARNVSFIEKFVGKDENSYIQRVTEFSKDEKGAKARIRLISDLTEQGTMGDYQLEGKEEAIVGSWQDITVDQIRHANRLEGRMNDQKMVINFREESKNVLAYWMASMADQMAFYHLSGIDPRVKLNGAVRAGFTYDAAGNTWSRDVGVAPTGYALYDHACMGAVASAPANEAATQALVGISYPTANRGLRWDEGTKSLQARDVTAVTSADTISYEMIVNLKAYAKEHYMRGVRGNGGEEEYLLIVGPRSMARLRLDADFLANSRALQTGMGDKSQLATGAGGVLVNGVRVIESRYVFNTQGATTLSASNQEGDWGRKWGVNGAAVDGERCLFLGAQALAYADLGLPSWEEDDYDYKNSQGIAIGKILGFKKPVFRSIYEGASPTWEDFGTITCDVAV